VEEISLSWNNILKDLVLEEWAGERGIQMRENVLYIGANA
jgi:hypothetical protein